MFQRRASAFRLGASAFRWARGCVAGGVRPSVNAARSAAAAAAQFAALFTEAGLAPAFFDQMRDKADDLEISVVSQTEAVGEGVDKTAALAETFRRMDETVERLVPLVTNKYRDNPAKLSAWESASRVERAPRSQPDADAPTPPAPNT